MPLSPAPPRGRHLSRFAFPTATALLLPLAACGLAGDGGTAPGSDEEGGHTPGSETIGLPTMVEDGDDSALLLEPNPETPVEEEYRIVVKEEGLPRTIIAFRAASPADDGMAFTFEVTWHPNNDDPVVEHGQFFVESGGERYTTAGERELAAPPSAGGNGNTVEVTITVPDAPESGAVYYQGADYAAGGDGLPPIGVCYRAGAGFDTDSCAG